MSYLHIPRICIEGTFEAGGATANNVLAALDEVNTPGFDIVSRFVPGKVDWNNNNSASNKFSILGSSSHVVSAWDMDGPVTSDPVLGAAVSGEGVMADLDPEHRRVTDLIGFKLNVALTSQQNSVLTGTLRPTQLRDFWVTSSAVDGEVYAVSTVWQSVLDGQWSSDLGQSKLLSRLAEASGDRLSVRLTMTHFGDAGNGKLIAVIGPRHDREPEQIAPGRRLTSPDWDPLSPGLPVPLYPGFPVASLLVDEPRSKLVVDLGNLVPRSFADPGTLLLGGLTAEVGGQAIASPRDLTVREWLKSAGLVEWDLTPEAQGLLANRPLGLEFTQDPTGTPKLLRLREHLEGKYVDVDRRSLRLNPGESATVHVYARRFGKPLPNEVVCFNLKQQAALDPLKSLGIQKGEPYYPPDPKAPINSDPADIFDRPAPFSVTTDVNGRGLLSLKVKTGPFTFPDARKSINSQLYFLGDPNGWQRWGALGPEVGAGCALTVLVFNNGPARPSPTWTDVAPILKRYARLYPVMRPYVDLGVEARVKENALMIRERLLLDVNDMKYMPVTRDLSAYERQLILNYLNVIAPPTSGQ